MNVDIIILLIFSILYGIGSAKLLQYEWKRLEKSDEKSQEESEDSMKKWYIFFGSALVVANIILIAVTTMVYTQKNTYQIVVNMTIVSLVWMAAITDFKFYIIPNETIIAGAILWVVFTLYKAIAFNEIWLFDLLDEGIAFVVLAVCLGLCLLVMKNSIGMGDVKLLLLLSLYFGLADLFSIVFLSLLCSFVGAVVLLIRKTKSRKDTIPFGPFLFLGTYLGMILSGI